MIERIEASCPCVKVSPTQIVLGPGETKSLMITFDPSIEAGFRGRLSVDLTGLGESGRLCFRTRVELEIRTHGGEFAARSGLEAETK
jgi:hypothetical protein